MNSTGNGAAARGVTPTLLAPRGAGLPLVVPVSWGYGAQDVLLAASLGLSLREYLAVERDLGLTAAALALHLGGGTGGGGIMAVVVCLECLADREEDDLRHVSPCGACDYVGWAEITDLARDLTFDLSAYIVAPRLRGNALRAALARFPWPPLGEGGR
jgi:hypothetical protein